MNTQKYETIFGKLKKIIVYVVPLSKEVSVYCKIKM